MLKIVIIASGKDYHDAAAHAASTFAVHVRSPKSVVVLIPAGEKASGRLARFSKEIGFEIEKFPLAAQPHDHYTSQLKCQAFAWQIARLANNDTVLFADADTCCLKTVRLPINVKKEIHAGRIGLVPDIADRHFRDPSVPWYLAPEERSTYVNSGVIFASRQSQPFFNRIRDLSEEPRFLTGPFNDQKVINYALGKYFPGQLVLLDRKYNAIRSIEKKTVIAHFAGGAGRLGQQRRKFDHERLCLRVLKSRLRPTSDSG